MVLMAGLFGWISTRARAYELVNSLPDGQVGVPYTPSPVIIPSVGSTVTVITQQPLPPGMQIDSQGMLSGTPLLGYSNAINLHIIYDTDKPAIEFGLPLTIKANPNWTEIVSTGKKVNERGIITLINDELLIVDNKIVVRFTNEMKVKYKKAPELELGQEVKYMGVRNNDNSVTATQIQVKKI